MLGGEKNRGNWLTQFYPKKWPLNQSLHLYDSSLLDGDINDICTVKTCTSYHEIFSFGNLASEKRS